MLVFDLPHSQQALHLVSPRSLRGGVYATAKPASTPAVAAAGATSPPAVSSRLSSPARSPPLRSYSQRDLKKLSLLEVPLANRASVWSLQSSLSAALTILMILLASDNLATRRTVCTSFQPKTRRSVTCG
jgi:hypothetical protein